MAKIPKGAPVIATLELVMKPEAFQSGVQKDWGLGPGVVVRQDVITTHDDRGAIALLYAQQDMIEKHVECRITDVRPKEQKIGSGRTSHAARARVSGDTKPRKRRMGKASGDHPAKP